MKTVNVNDLLREGREKAKRGRATAAIADLIMATRGIPEGSMLGILLNVGDTLTNRDAVFAWARQYLEGTPLTGPLDAHKVLADYDNEIRERLDELAPF